ncbi:hypothetical protein OG728_38895 (plasmid) [Streptomyces microflavus]|uniref:hypothetical protein n=1 Tax=Streptomyces microflavus TaxID=1919 RepID=UPI002E0E6565|nr:hypothetical protein OG728_38895 [Streptomyces microflavus]
MITFFTPRRIAAGLMLPALALGFLTGCTTDSPPQHSERLQRAAGLKEFHVVTTKELWKKTSDQGSRDGADLEISSTTTDLETGLVQVELTGVSLANYLRVLDYMAHGGTDSTTFGRHRQAESIRMYDEISGVLDGIKKRPAGSEPPPKVVVDNAFVDAKR